MVISLILSNFYILCQRFTLSTKHQDTSSPPTIHLKSSWFFLKDVFNSYVCKPHFIVGIPIFSYTAFFTSTDITFSFNSFPKVVHAFPPSCSFASLLPKFLNFYSFHSQVLFQSYAFCPIIQQVPHLNTHSFPFISFHFSLGNFNLTVPDISTYRILSATYRMPSF